MTTETQFKIKKLYKKIEKNQIKRKATKVFETRAGKEIVYMYTIYPNDIIPFLQYINKPSLVTI